MPHPAPVIRHLGEVEYQASWDAMRAFTAARTPASADELWLLQHPPVFTLGQAGRREHLLTDVGIPVIAVDRGGQVTYHGPGQVVAYVLVDLRRLGYGVRELVQRLEQAVIDLLVAHGLEAARKEGAPGVYVAGAKIAALGLRVRQGCTYHGLSLNVDPDLTPFAAINPCGYPGLGVTSMRALGLATTAGTVADALADDLPVRLGLGPA